MNSLIAIYGTVPLILFISVAIFQKRGDKRFAKKCFKAFIPTFGLLILLVITKEHFLSPSITIKCEHAANLGGTAFAVLGLIKYIQKQKRDCVICLALSAIVVVAMLPLF